MHARIDSPALTVPGAPDAVSDELWAEVSRHYDDRRLAGLVITIAGINAWKRTHPPDLRRLNRTVACEQLACEQQGCLTGGSLQADPAVPSPCARSSYQRR